MRADNIMEDDEKSIKIRIKTQTIIRKSCIQTSQHNNSEEDKDRKTHQGHGITTNQRKTTETQGFLYELTYSSSHRFYVEALEQVLVLSTSNGDEKHHTIPSLHTYIHDPRQMT